MPNFIASSLKELSFPFGNDKGKFLWQANGRNERLIYTKNEEAERVKASLNDVKSTDTEQNSLLDFYKKSEEGADPTNMGMYYISYLSEACEKVNVRFESNVNQFADSDLTVMNMFFMF